MHESEHAVHNGLLLHHARPIMAVVEENRKCKQNWNCPWMLFSRELKKV
jgi:hypothetical protein